ncbi:hypothetical protein ABZ299_30520 [Streptomyces sp. NPDC006184]|uniref:hypothetical protein n=1 Tax=Streptomyces sp. NPDC006184 TaxID=3155455 RepID=UPI0033BE5070
MEHQDSDQPVNRYCKACGTPAGEADICQRCGTVLTLPDGAGLTEDDGAVVRRDFEGRGQ